MGFVGFMGSGLGRGLRIVVGIVLIVIGWRMQSTAGTVLWIVGLVPLAAGLFNFCLVAPLVRSSH